MWIGIVFSCIFCYITSSFNRNPTLVVGLQNELLDDTYSVATLVLLVMSCPMFVDTILDQIYITATKRNIDTYLFCVVKALLQSAWCLPNFIIYFWCIEPLNLSLFVACNFCQSILFQGGFIILMNVNDITIWTNFRCNLLMAFMLMSFFLKNISILVDGSHILTTAASVLLVTKEFATGLLFLYWLKLHNKKILNILTGDVSLADDLTNSQLVVKFYVIVFVCFSTVGYAMFFAIPNSYYFSIVIVQIVCVSLFTLLPGKIAFRNAQLSNVSVLQCDTIVNIIFNLIFIVESAREKGCFCPVHFQGNQRTSSGSQHGIRTALERCC